MKVRGLCCATVTTTAQPREPRAAQPGRNIAPIAPPPQAIELLFCELSSQLVVATKDTARPLLGALGATSSLPPAAVQSVRRLVDVAAGAATADANELDGAIAAVKAIALDNAARSALP